jgi:hypothetical protein
MQPSDFGSGLSFGPDIEVARRLGAVSHFHQQFWVGFGTVIYSNGSCSSLIFDERLVA